MRDILKKHPVNFLRQELQTIKKQLKVDLDELKAITKLSKNKVIDLLIKHNYDTNKLPPIIKIATPKPKAEIPKVAILKEELKMKEPKIKEPKMKVIKEKKVINEDVKLKRELKIFPLSYFYSIDDIINNYKKSFTKIGQKDRIENDIQDLKNYQIVVNEKFTNKRKKSNLLNERLKKYLDYNQNRINKANIYLKTLN